MRKIIKDYLDELEDKAKHSDKYFIERNELYIEKEQIKNIIRKWNNMSNISIFELNNLLHEINDIVFKTEIIRKESDKE